MMLIMKKNRYRNYKSRREIKTDRVFTALVILFLLGTLIGAVLSAATDINSFKYAEHMTLSYIELRSSQTEKEIFSSIFIPNAAAIIFLFFIRGLSLFAPFLWALPLFQGLGFGLYAVNVLKSIGKNNVKIFAFTVFQEKFWTILVIIAVCTFIIKTDVMPLHKNGFGNTRPLKGNLAGLMILSILLMALASAVSTFAVVRFGCPLLRGL